MSKEKGTLVICNTETFEEFCDRVKVISDEDLHKESEEMFNEFYENAYEHSRSIIVARVERIILNPKANSEARFDVPQVSLADLAPKKVAKPRAPRRKKTKTNRATT